MAFVQKDLSFSNFIKEFFEAPQKLPPYFLREVYALYIRQRKTILTSITIDAPEGAASTASVLSTYVAGGEEALLDVKGVNTRVNIEDLLKHPLLTIKSIGDKTFEDITKLDELAGDRRSDVIESLVAGNLSIGDRDLTEPSNLTVQALRKLGLSIVDKSQLVRTVGPRTESAIRLLGTVNDVKEDRQVLEQNKSRGTHYKAYKSLAGNLTGLAGYMESNKPRAEYYRESLIAYNRAVASELGIDLDRALPARTGRIYEAEKKAFKPDLSKGTFKEALEDQVGAGFTNVNDALEDLLNDDNKLRKALGLAANTPDNNRIWANLDRQSKEYTRHFLRSEFVTQEFYEKFDLIGGKSAFILDVETNPIFAEIAKTKHTHPTRGSVDSSFKKGIIERETQRRALEAHVRIRLADNVIRSKVSDAAAILRERQILNEVETAQGLARGSIPDMFDPRVPADIQRDIPIERMRASEAARERLLSATTASDIANNLFFASTTKEMLENLEKGKFLDVVLTSTKVLGLLPFTSSKWGSPAEYTQYADKFMIGKTITAYQKVKNNAFAFAGLAFEEAKEGNLKGIAKAFPNAFKGEAWVGWEREKTGTRRPGGRPKLEWTQGRIGSGTAEGIFGPAGLEDILTSGSEKLQEFGFPNFQQYAPDKLLEDLDKTDDFLQKLYEGGTAVTAPGTVPSDPYQKLAKFVGLDTWDSLDAFDDNLGKLRDPNNGGYKFLRFMSSNTDHPGGFALEPARRWAFIRRIRKEGKDAQLLKPFAGLLNRYNRVANALYTFLYREILWGGYAGRNVIIKGISAMLTPIRPILNGIGFGEEVLLGGAVQQWGIIKWFKSVGNSFSRLGTNPTYATSFMGKFLTPTILKSLGFLVTNIGSIVTGGLSYLIAGLGDIGWAFGKQLLRGNIGGAFKTAEKMFIDKIRAINKLVAGIVLGILSCISIPFIFVIAIVAMLAPMELSTGGGAYADVISSKKVAVTKTATLSGSNIEYRITIKNITDSSRDPEIPPQEVKISSFVDTLKYTKSCADGGGTIDVTTDPGYGSVSLPTIGNPTIAPGETLEVGPFTLSNIRLGDGTYLNSVEVVVENDSNKKGEASASTKLGVGGCAVCPAGWPTQPFVLSQGAQSSDTHKNAEALDFASNIGQAIRATHNGTAYASTMYCKSPVEGDPPVICGYGNYVMVESPMGFSTVYAHLSGFNVSNEQQVTAGEVIGAMGNTGNSTGPHVHYEFKDTSIQCIPGENLKMKHIQGESYIPQDIPSPGCVGPINCNMSVQ